MLTEQAIEDFKSFIDRTIAYAKVTINGTESKLVIHRRERLEDGRVAIYLQITPGNSSDGPVPSPLSENGSFPLQRTLFTKSGSPVAPPSM